MENKGTVLFTCGVWDMLHWGHVSFLQACKKHCDFLLVGMNSDYSTRVLKGKGRPIIPEFERKMMLSALECVNGVITFDEPDASNLILTFRPHIFAKSIDYAGIDIPEFTAAAQVGTEILFIQPGEYEAEIHTSGIIRRVIEKEVLK